MGVVRDLLFGLAIILFVFSGLAGLAEVRDLGKRISELETKLEARVTALERTAETQADTTAAAIDEITKHRQALEEHAKQFKALGRRVAIALRGNVTVR